MSISPYRYTLRNIPEILENKIKSVAYNQDMSINTVILDALSSFFLGKSSAKQIKRDISWFAGKDKISDDFDGNLIAARSIDKELWR